MSIMVDNPLYPPYFKGEIEGKRWFEHSSTAIAFIPWIPKSVCPLHFDS